MQFIPIPIPSMILFPFPWECHETHGIPVFPVPMHISTGLAATEHVQRSGSELHQVLDCLHGSGYQWW